MYPIPPYFWPFLKQKCHWFITDKQIFYTFAFFISSVICPFISFSNFSTKTLFSCWLKGAYKEMILILCHIFTLVCLLSLLIYRNYIIFMCSNLIISFVTVFPPNWALSMLSENFKIVFILSWKISNIYLHTKAF